MSVQYKVVYSGTEISEIKFPYGNTFEVEDGVAIIDCDKTSWKMMSDDAKDTMEKYIGDKVEMEKINEE